MAIQPDSRQQLLRVQALSERYAGEVTEDVGKPIIHHVHLSGSEPAGSSSHFRGDYRKPRGIPPPPTQ